MTKKQHWNFDKVKMINMHFKNIVLHFAFIYKNSKCETIIMSFIVATLRNCM